MPLANFGVGQRLFSIYDGPAYQESNIYLDITKTTAKLHVLRARRASESIPDQRSRSSPAICPMPPSAGSSPTASSIRRPSTRPTCSSTRSISATTSSSLFEPNTYLENTDERLGLKTCLLQP